MLFGILSSSFQESMVFLWDSDFACAANPPCLYVAFFQCLNPFTVNAEFLEEERLKTASRHNRRQHLYFGSTQAI